VQAGEHKGTSRTAFGQEETQAMGSCVPKTDLRDNPTPPLAHRLVKFFLWEGSSDST